MLNKKLIIIAGPCLAESESIVLETASELSRITNKYDIQFFFKASYRKANRSSINSISGYGDEKALNWIANAAKKYNLKSITDIHNPNEAELAANYVDALQIPAFLSRQTDLLLAAGNTKKIVNIKKGQFMAPDDMIKATNKVLSTGNSNILLTERGTSFGYHDLVVDFRGVQIMSQTGFPVIFDATHSVQRPSIGEQSGGNPQFIEKLTFASLASGVDGIFFETHPDPKNAISDSATQLQLEKAEDFISKIIDIYKFFSKFE